MAETWQLIPAGLVDVQPQAQALDGPSQAPQLVMPPLCEDSDYHTAGLVDVHPCYGQGLAFGALAL